LFLDDAKAPNCQKNNGFSDLGNYSEWPKVAGAVIQAQKCARCRQTIQSDPAFDDDLWYHRTCLEEGKQDLQRAHELAARFGFSPEHSRHA